VSAPVGRETPQRRVAQHRRGIDSLAKRPAPPVEGAANSYCYMDWNAGGAVTVNTIQSPITIGGDYEEGFISDPDFASFSLDLATGIIEWNEPGQYFITGWAQFGGGATVGSKLEVLLTLGNNGSFSTFRIGNHIIADSINEVFRIPVSAPVFSFNPGVFGHDGVRLEVDHNDAGGQDLNSVHLQVFQIANFVTGTFLP
jgi:hypothetical protein